MGIPTDLTAENPGINEWAICIAYRGSIAHGMYVPKSDPNSIDDKDVMAVCVPPLEYYFGQKEFHSHGTQEIKRDEWDIVVYEARKFIHLLSIGNPNVLTLLYLDPNYYIEKTSAFDILINNRDAFLGRHVYRSFIGYAYGQLHRMTHGQKLGHMGEKRKELFDKYGYDCKNAAHLIRLLRMSIEYLKDGHLYVTRSDAPQLLEIKKGEWTMEQVEKESERLFKLAEEAYLKCELPKEPNINRINALSIEVIKKALPL
jgi:predicted nucleotidyltransferase